MFDHAKCRFGMRVSKNDFLDHINDPDKNRFLDKRIFGFPGLYPERVTGVKSKISEVLNIRFDDITVYNVTVSNKKFPIAWVTTDRAMADLIFERASRVGKEIITIFPSTPHEASERRGAVERILLDLKKHDADLIYQIENGRTDIRIRKKFFSKFRYCKWRTIPLEYLDRKGVVPEIHTVTKEKTPDSKEENVDEIDESNPENWQKFLRKNKRKATSPIKRPNKFVKTTQKEMIEYLRAYAYGTAGEPEMVSPAE